MIEDEDPDDLNALLLAAAPDDAARARLLEAHRQLEKDLLRLADPLPPPDFLSTVMTRVAAEAPPLSRADFVSGFSIFGVAVVAALALLVGDGVTHGHVGAVLAQVLVAAHAGTQAAASALGALWNTAALPVAMGLSLVLAGALTALRRLMQPGAAKVSL